jgi:hypothetical protein
MQEVEDEAQSSCAAASSMSSLSSSAGDASSCRDGYKLIKKTGSTSKWWAFYKYIDVGA